MCIRDSPVVFLQNIMNLKEKLYLSPYICHPKAISVTISVTPSFFLQNIMNVYQMINWCRLQTLPIQPSMFADQFRQVIPSKFPCNLEFAEGHIGATAETPKIARRQQIMQCKMRQSCTGTRYVTLTQHLQCCFLRRRRRRLGPKGQGFRWIFFSKLRQWPTTKNRKSHI